MKIKPESEISSQYHSEEYNKWFIPLFTAVVSNRGSVKLAVGLPTPPADI